MTVYLTAFQLLTLTGSLLGHEPEVRDLGMLESVVARPQAAVMGVDAYPTLDLKAAALLDSVVSNRAFVDGNKRAGLVAAHVFYRLNGYTFDAPFDGLRDLILGVADGSVRDLRAIAATLTPWRSLES